MAIKEPFTRLFQSLKNGLHLTTPSHPALCVCLVQREATAEGPWRIEIQVPPSFVCVEGPSVVNCNSTSFKVSTLTCFPFFLFFFFPSQGKWHSIRANWRNPRGEGLIPCRSLSSRSPAISLWRWLARTHSRLAGRRAGRAADGSDGSHPRGCALVSSLSPSSHEVIEVGWRVIGNWLGEETWG